MDVITRRRFGLLISILTIFTLSINAFNLDLNTRVVHKTSADSWFGFDIEFYTDDKDVVWLLVGAPKDQSPKQVEIRRGGRVYRCSTTSQSCQSISRFEEKGNAKGLNGSEQIEMESKSGQWLGASISASVDGTRALACAPRYVYYYKHDQRNGPTGYCYLATNNFQDITQIAPGRHDIYWGQHRLGYSLFGFSSGFDRTGTTMFLGGPGAWYWQGALAVATTSQLQDTKTTPAGDERHDNSYMGYSMAIGDFDGDGYDDCAVGVPRADYVMGMVSMYTKDLHSLHNITGTQVGSYFGYSLAATDLDGDGLDDIIIGEPFYVKYTKEKGVAKQEYEIGKVHVYFQGADHAFRKFTSVEGTKQWSQFGLAVAAAGDLNADGFNDFLVGAPYDGPSKRGAIYVYHGMEGGIRDKYSQVIYSEDVAQDMRTFGFSFATKKDIDKNEYPDVAIGAFATSNAVVLRSRPVITVTGTVKVQNPDIDLEEKVCNYAGEGVACDSFELCLKYTGKGAPDNLDVKVLLSFDAKEIVSRAQHLSFGVSRMSADKRLTKDESMCDRYQFLILNNIRNKLSPIVIEANYSLGDDAFSKQLRPVLDVHVPPSIKGQINIRNRCGQRACVPDLSMNVAPVDGPTLTLGTGRKLKLSVNVTNNKDDAYEAQLFVRIPPGLEYAGFEKRTGAITCSFATEKDKNVKKDDDKTKLMVCDIGNPLETGTSINAEFVFDPHEIDAKQQMIQFVFNVSSANPEVAESMSDNVRILDIPVEVSVQLKLNGASKPDQVNYGKSDYRNTQEFVFDDQIGPLVTHVYEVSNDGPSDLTGAHLDIYWPSYTSDGKQLLYLIDKPVIESPTGTKVQCQVEQGLNVNPLSYNIDRSVIQTFRVKRQTRQPVQQVDDYGIISRVTNSLRRVVEAITVDKQQNIKDPSGTLNRANVNCEKMNCTHISCNIGHMADGDSAAIYIHSRLWLNTLIDYTHYDSQISSAAVAEVYSIPHASAVSLPLVTTAVTTRVNPTDPRVTKRGVPWWLYLLAILAGLTLLSLLIMFLWRMGFFKRNRPPRGQALLSGPPQGDITAEHYGFAGGASGYAPATGYSEAKHGQRI